MSLHIIDVIVIFFAQEELLALFIDLLCLPRLSQNLSVSIFRRSYNMLTYYVDVYTFEIVCMFENENQA